MGGIVVSPDEIDGVYIRPLKVFNDNRGFVKHMLRADAPHYTGFGEIYFSFTNQHVIKAWKRHRLISQNMAVPQGNMLFVMYDARQQSPSYGKLAEIILGEDNYSLLQMPPGIIYGFQALSAPGALIVNCINMPFQPDESESYPINNSDIPYRWQHQDDVA